MRKDFKVEGMSCINCARTIELTLKKTPGIRSVKVSFELGRVSVEYDEEKVSPQEIARRIEELGYRVVEEKSKREEILLLFSGLSSILILTSMLLSFPFKYEIQAFLSTLIQFAAGLKFYRGAYTSLKQGVAGMDVLVSLGTSGAYLYSLLSYLHLIPGMPMFETNVFLITFVRLGKYIEEKAREKAIRGLKEVFTLSFQSVKVLVDGKEIEKNVREVFRGEKVIYRSGDQILLDGIVLEGYALVNESIITGEVMPVPKRMGDEVISGSIVENGYLITRVEKSFDSSYINKIRKFVEEALQEKPRIQRLSDKVSHYFVQFVIILALITFGIWYFIDADLQKATLFSLAVLVVSCPCAFGIAVPLAVAVGIFKAIKKGILLKKPSIFETIPKLDVIIFDKTGTLTEGKFKVEESKIEEKFLPVVYSMEEFSNHPIARAIREFLKGKVRNKVKLGRCKEIPGMGVMCDEYLIGKGELWGLKGQNGNIIVGFGTEDKLLGYFLLKDSLRKEAKEVVEFLKGKGLKLVMLTGDRKENALRMARELGIEEVIAEVRPEEKKGIVEKYKKEDLKVCMVGDGINDAPALASADVGIAVSSGTDLAKVAGDVIIHNLFSLKALFLLSEKVYRKIKENLFWALIYNTLFIPAAAGLFYKFGIYLKPEFAGLLMTLSSISVVLNTLRLLKD